ncbi:EAL domain-containing protein [Oceanobacillus sp. CAU 1775]
MEKQQTIMDLDFYHVIQPIIDIKNNHIFGYEMLLRSNEIKNPELLFQYAEQEDLLFDLDMHSIQKAFEAINLSTSDLEGLHIFINIHPSTVRNPITLSQLSKLKADMKLESGKIVFEITEAKKEAELMMCQNMIVNLKNEDFLIALDDLGKGDSTIPYIIELEPHVVKIDRYFSEGLAKSTRKQKVVESLIKLFSDETMYILEGIETEADLEKARELGVRYVQGFYLGKPESFEHYLNQ